MYQFHFKKICFLTFIVTFKFFVQCKESYFEIYVNSLLLHDFLTP